MTPNTGYELLQGSGKVSGHLVGGCLGPPGTMVKGTDYFPPKEAWNDSIIFIGGGLPYASGLALKHNLRSLGVMGIFEKAKPIIHSNPGKEEG